jgi:hypothetical protein
VITLFCVRFAGEAPPPADLFAAANRLVERVEVGGLGAWICDGELTRDLAGIRAHDAVVRSALRSATPLPVRFGTVFASKEDLVEALTRREDEFLSDLDRVKGKVEMALRVKWREEARQRGQPAQPPRQVHSGRQYLEARKGEMEEAEAAREHAAALLEVVEARVAPDAFAVVHRVLPEPGVAGMMAHLVHRHGVGEYRERVEEARSAFSDLELHLTGPWAPYSFV